MIEDLRKPIFCSRCGQPIKHGSIQSFFTTYEGCTDIKLSGRCEVCKVNTTITFYSVIPEDVVANFLKEVLEHRISREDALKSINEYWDAVNEGGSE